MHALLGGIADAAVRAAEVDPTKQPVRGSFYAFIFLAVCLVLLIISLRRHLRRVDQNLGSESDPDAPVRTTPVEPGPDAP